MSEHYEKASFKKLLEKLQEESWQLELIISGFAIFGLFTAIGPISLAAKEAQNAENPYSYFTLAVLMVSCGILIFNLLVHVVLRGLWIGSLGLRYVSGDIEFDALKYSPKFTKYLKKKVGSFDKYIATLENYCSVMFAISFLLIFYVLAFTLIMLSLALISIYVLDNEDLPNYISKGLGIPLLLFLVFGMLFTFIDFITQGWLKKKQWISKIYFPFYWVFSLLTLSFLYRPLVYNFLDNRFGKRLSFMLVPIYFVILIASSLYYNKSNYLDLSNRSADYYANNRNYEELIADKKNVFINRVAIPSKVITDPFLKIFIPYQDNVEDYIFDFNHSLKPEKDKRGLRADIQFSDDEWSFEQVDSISREYLKTFNAIYTVKIDSTLFATDFILAQSTKEELGFETYIKIDSLQEGRHLLNVKRKMKEGDANITFDVAKIPFWYFKN